MTIRTRFAPSPTGFLHVGGIRTALFAYLVAKQTKGQFILRLEDTDQKREVSGSAEHILECLKALQISPDEGTEIGGDFGPYKQSERLEIYKEWAQKLIDEGRAYADPYTSEEVQKFREQAQKEKKAFLYRHHRPENPPEWDGTQPLRFKSDPKSYNWHDEVMGNLHSGPEVIDDFILIKSDGYPTYNFAHIIDDMLMEITHVIRGQEFLASMPNYLNLYDALGFDMAAVEPLATSFSETSTARASAAAYATETRREAVSENDGGEKANGNTLPFFATMPHIMNEQGNKKLSKRDGAKDVLDYINEGYLPETLVSFIATLGWNDGTELEVFSRKELIEKFSLTRVQKSGARFDEKRLLWMNGQFIRNLSLDELEKAVESYWTPVAAEAEHEYRREVLSLAQDRLKTLQDLPLLTSYFFEEPDQNWDLLHDDKKLKQLRSDEIKNLLETTCEALERTDWNPDAIQATLNDLLMTTDQKPAVLFSLIRTVTAWAPFSPQLNDTLTLIGKDRTLARIKQAIEQA